MYETHSNRTYDLNNVDEDFLSHLNKFEIDLLYKNYKIIKDNYYNGNDELHSTVYKDGEKYCEITHYYTHIFEFSVIYLKDTQMIKEEWYMLNTLSSVIEYDVNGNCIKNISLSPFEPKEMSEYNYETNETYLLRDEEVEMYLT